MKEEERTIDANGADSAFAAALRDALSDADVSQTALADVLGVTQSAIGQWCSAKKVPGPRTVFLLERTLRLPDGALSQHLGYRPDTSAPAGHEAIIKAIYACDDLSAAARKTLVAIVKTYAESPHRLGEPNGSRPVTRSR